MLEEQSLFTPFHYTALAALSTILEQMSCKLNLSTHSNREFYSLLIGASPNECSSSFLALGKHMYIRLFWIC